MGEWGAHESNLKGVAVRNGFAFYEVLPGWRITSELERTNVDLTLLQYQTACQMGPAWLQGKVGAEGSMSPSEWRIHTTQQSAEYGK